MRLPVLTDRRAAGLFALMAYVPMLLTRPGAISADTKTYLNLDPARLLGRAWSMWDPWVGAGTVTHQNLGYLFPLGPVHLVADRLGVPDWVTQRLIWGTVVWVAAWGTWKLVRWLGWSATAALVAAVAYAWSPYLLSYLARLSVILLPWAALPWLIRYAALAVRSSSWRAPARFAGVVALVGSVNATALVLVGLGPVLWVAAQWWTGEHRTRAVLAGAARTGVLTGAVSVWWILGLWVQGRYGLPILDYTETYPTVAASSTPQEILRGLGYWFFYGGDRLGPWVGPAGAYLSPWMIALGTVLAAAGLVGLSLRFTARTPVVTMWAVGLMVAVGAAPLGDPSPYGRMFLGASSSTVGMALRSTPRAAPLVLLAMALGLGLATAAVGRRLSHVLTNRAVITPGRALWVRGAVTAVVLLGLGVQMFPWFTGRVMTEGTIRPSEMPAYRVELADWLMAQGSGRVWEIPGSDFASYRWGGTVDPVLPGMIDRPTLARELVPQGGPGTTSLLAALDTRIQEGTFEPASLRAVAQRLGVSTIVMRADLQHERYRLVRPGTLWPRLVDALGPPDFMGPMTTDRPVIQMIDEIWMADARRAEQFPILAAWNLGTDATTDSPVGLLPAAVALVAGDGDGLVDIAAAGLLAPDQPVLMAGTLVADPAASPGSGGPVILTDTNARRARRWSTLGAHSGAIEAAGEVAVPDDAGDRRLALFPGTGDELRAVRVHLGPVASITASSYGNRFAHTPEDAAHFAMDGDPTTAWRAGVFDDLRGESLRIELRNPVTVDHIHLLQPTARVVTRYLTRVALHFDSGVSMEVALDERSRTGEGQRIEVPAVAFRVLRVELLEDNLPGARIYRGQPGAGIAEIHIGDLRAESTVAVPTDWLDEIPDLAERPIDLVMTRVRIDPAIPNRADPELMLDRQVSLPVERTFQIAGTVRLHTGASDAVIAAAIGAGAPAAHSNGRLAGSVHTWGWAAVDNDLTTAWITPFDLDQRPEPHLRLRVPPSAVDGTVTLYWRDDPHHSTPEQVRVTIDGHSTPEIDLAPGAQPVPGWEGAQRTAVIDLGMIDLASTPHAASDHELVIEVTRIAPRTSPDYNSGVPRVLPVAITEVEIRTRSGALLDLTPPPAHLPDDCRDDLLLLDGQPVPVRLTGDVPSALARGSIDLAGCTTVMLGAGPHRIQALDPRRSGLDLDRLVLRSAPDAPPTAATASRAEWEPTALIAARRVSPVRHVVDLGPRSAPTWLVLRESHNPGWVARLDGGPALRPTSIDGWANGWLLPAGAAGQVVLEWTPQRVIQPALLISSAALLLVIWLGIGTLAPGSGAPAGQRRRPSWVHLVGLTALCALAGGPVAAVTFLVLRLGGRSRPWLAPAVAFSLWGASALFTAALQFGFRFPADPDWPSRFAAASPLVWAAVAAVLASGSNSDRAPVAQ